METHRSIFRVIKAVADAAGVSPMEFVKRRRHQHIAQARHLAIYLVRYHFPNLTLIQIGEIFHREHSSVLHSVHTHARLLAHLLPYRELERRVQQQLARN